MSTAAIATIQNAYSPTTVELLTFANNSVGDVRLYLREAARAVTMEDEPNADKSLSAASQTRATGKLMNPSALVAMLYKRFPSVYGCVDNKVVKLCPLWQEFGSEGHIDSNAPSLAGCSDGDDLGWLYFYNTKGALHELPLVGGSVKLNKLAPLEGSSLAAIYFGTKIGRRVIYQNSPASDDATVGGDLTIASPENGGTHIDSIPGTTNAKTKTPIAACVVHNDDEKARRVYIYYINGNDGAVYRLVSDAGTLNFSAGPTQPASLTSKPVAFSQIAVTPVKDEGVNYVTYVVIATSGNTYRMFKDPW